ncbi:MAG: hypothetical protein HRU09_06040 [Oligoflexales bacterium]|nr:hypothetical protein [Oligoflexales bacterium]
MGKHVFTLNLRMEIESDKITDGESGATLEVAPEILYNMVSSLRSEALAEIDELTSSEFDEAMDRSKDINTILGKIEELYDTEELIEEE